MRPTPDGSAIEGFLAPAYARQRNAASWIIFVLTLGFFIGAGLYLKTIKPVERIAREVPLEPIQTRFVMSEKKERPKAPKPKPVARAKQEKSEKPVDLTKPPPRVVQRQAEAAREENAPEPVKEASPARRVYGLRRVFASGLGSGGEAGEAIIGKRGNSLEGPIDTVTATKNDLINNFSVASAASVTTPPVLKSAVKPEYTKEMRDAGVEGVVRAELLIDAGGAVKEVRILNDLGHGTAEGARAAFLKWIFEPARRNGEAVAVRIIYAIRFVLL